MVWSLVCAIGSYYIYVDSYLKFTYGHLMPPILLKYRETHSNKNFADRILYIFSTPIKDSKQTILTLAARLPMCVIIAVQKTPDHLSLRVVTPFRDSHNIVRLCRVMI